MIKLIEVKHKLISIPSPKSQPAIMYKIDNYKGNIGFISSMTQPFCSTCNRIRLTADGNLKICLHDDYEVDMKQYIRNKASDDEIESIIRNALLNKKEKHSGVDSLSEESKNNKGRPMTKIGG